MNKTTKINKRNKVMDKFFKYAKNCLCCNSCENKNRVLKIVYVLNDNNDDADNTEIIYEFLKDFAIQIYKNKFVCANNVDTGLREERLRKHLLRISESAIDLLDKNL